MLLRSVLLAIATTACDPGITVTDVRTRELPADEPPVGASEKAAGKLAAADCIDPDLSAVKAGVKLMLCDGSIAEGTLVECSEDGATDCMANELFKAADVAGLSDVVLEGNVVAGVEGALLNCSSANSQGCYATGLYYASTMCSADGGTECVVDNGTNYAAAAKAGAAAKILTGQSVAGISGSHSPDFPDPANVRSTDTVDGDNGTLADCSAGGATGCVTIAAYKSVQISGLAAKVKNGVLVAGETGTYPSSGNLLEGADSTADLSANAAARDAQLKSATSFEWFLPDGTRATGAGDADIAAANIVSGVTIFGAAGSASAGSDPDPWDLRYGVTVGSTTGKLKLNCRNMVGSYNNTTSPASAGTDVFDTVDDHNNNGGFPSTNPWDSDGYFCGYNNPDPTWERVSTTPATSGANSVFKDKISGLNWTRGNATSIRNWNASLTYCDDLDHGGVDSWRLPTQKELMEAYSHGIYDLDSGHTSADHLGDLDTWFWSSSTLSYGMSYAWYVYLGSGDINFKTGSESVLCVSP